jgi:hypothetical protein
MNSENKSNSTKYDGHCAFAVSTGKLDVKGGNHTLDIENDTYLFSNGVAKFLFKLLPNRIHKADENWKNK